MARNSFGNTKGQQGRKLGHRVRVNCRHCSTLREPLVATKLPSNHLIVGIQRKKDCAVLLHPFALLHATFFLANPMFIAVLNVWSMRNVSTGSVAMQYGHGAAEEILMLVEVRQECIP